jgi:hypothetical protein
LVLAALLATPIACRDVADPPISDPDAFTVNATVVFVDVEGGCWALDTDASTRFEPDSLPDEFKRSGLRVHATLKLQREWGSYCLVGPVVEVLWIRLR